MELGTCQVTGISDFYIFLISIMFVILKHVQICFSFFSPKLFWNRQDIIEALAEATERGVIIVTCTQCSSGAVSDDYDDDDDDIDDDDDYIDDDGDYKLSTVNSIQVSGIYETGKALIDIGVIILQ